MSTGFNKQFEGIAHSQSRAAHSEGLRKYMLGIYNYMASGVALSAIIALFIANSPAAIQLIFGTPLKWVIMFAPLGVVLFMSFRYEKMSAGAMKAAFFVYAALVGASLSAILLVFTGESVARVFMITTIMFAALSLFGYTTKKDLSGFGTFLFMGVIGILVASIVNIFLGSSTLHLAISAVGVLVFAGLTAYDTQKLKDQYFYLGGASGEEVAKLSIFGALTLYIDFVAMFQFLMSFLGNRE